MFVIDINKLERGDIVLIRYPDDKNSQDIIRKCGGNYSHAMLCVDYSSVVEAGTIVEASNPIREILTNVEDACVLRLKSEYRTTPIINKAVEYARRYIGMQYSVSEAIRALDPPAQTKEPNRQICSRLVAKAFDYAGIKIVDNIDYCTVADIESSPLLEKMSDIIMEASPQIMEFVESENLLNSQTEILFNLFEACRDLYGEDIQTFEQLTPLTYKYPEKTENLISIISDSGYLDLWRKEEDINPFNFDTKLFIDKYSEHLRDAVLQNRIALNECKGRYEVQLETLKLIALYNGNNLYINCLINLYDNLIAQCHRREKVLNEVEFYIKSHKKQSNNYE